MSSRATEISLPLLLHLIQRHWVFTPFSHYEPAALTVELPAHNNLRVVDSRLSRKLYAMSVSRNHLETLNWGASFIPSDGDVGKFIGPLVSGIVSSLGAVYTLLIRKMLDRTTGPVLYKPACAHEYRAHEGKISMLTIRTYKERPMKWQPCAAMYTVVHSLGLTLSAINTFGGRLGQQASRNRRKTTH